MFGRLPKFGMACLLLLIFAATASYSQNMSAPPDSTKMETELKKNLDSLVKSSAITEKQEAAIIKHMLEAGKNGTPPSKDSMNGGSGPISELIADGTITKDQADAVARALPKPPSMANDNGNGMPPTPPDSMGDSNGMPPAPPNSSSMEADFKKGLDSLVSSNVITEKQEIAIFKHMQDARKNGPPPAGGQMNGANGPFSDLVTDGTLTKDQADAAAKALPKPPSMGDGNGMPPTPPDSMESGDGNGFPPPPPGSMGGNGVPPAPPGSSREKIATTGAYTLSTGEAFKTNETLSSEKSNESVIKVCNGASLSLKKVTLKKTGDSSSSENSDFNGLNAAILAESGGKIEISDCTIKTDAVGANAVFVTGSKSLIKLNNVTIYTTGHGTSPAHGSSRGLDGTYGGTIIAKNVNITTHGQHSAAVATDRGGANITVTGGMMNTYGAGSPGIYSTGNISVTGAKMTAYGSEGAVIEGKNSISVTDTTLIAKKSWGAMLYQSFSGDAEVGTSVFTMKGGSLTAEEGPLFYTTNTQCRVNLDHATLTEKSGVLLKAAAGRWGRTGSNGSKMTFTAEREKLSGDVLCDKLSALTIVLKNKTILEGSIDTENTAKSIDLSLDKTSKWNVTKDSHLTSLTDADTSLSNILSNGHTVYYDSTASSNGWLGNKSHSLAGGGKLIPEKE